MTEPDTTTTEEPTGSPSPAWWVDGDVAPCPCGRTREHTIRRLNLPGTPRLCDPCHDERTSR